VLDLAILGLLGDGPLHGYEIRRRLRAQMGIAANVSFGSLYPALARLEAAGDVVVLEAEEPVATLPATGSLSGERAALRSRRLVAGRGRRSKKVYRLTEQGAAHFAALLNATPSSDDQRSFGLRWSFARHLGPDARLALLERRRAQLVQQLGDAEDSAGLDDYARSVVEHAADNVSRDIAWLDDLIAAERTKRATTLEATRGASAPPETSPAQPGA
jgi:DNA-binding PadR family transcriptional regulator